MNLEAKDKLLPLLRCQSTWALLGFGVITLGIYWGHYIKRQTQAINTQLQPVARISNGLVLAIMILAYVTVIALFTYYIVPMEFWGYVDFISDWGDRIFGILIIVWGFKARNRINRLLGCKEGSLDWFHGCWTFFLSPMYFNYKVNVLSEHRRGLEGNRYDKLSSKLRKKHAHEADDYE